MNIIALLSCYKPRILKDLPRMKIGKSRKYRFTRNDKVTITKVTDNTYEIFITESLVSRPTYYLGPISIIRDRLGYEVPFLKFYGCNLPCEDSIVNKDNIEFVDMVLCYRMLVLETMPNVDLAESSYIYVKYRCFGGPYVI